MNSSKEHINIKLALESIEETSEFEFCILDSATTHVIDSEKLNIEQEIESINVRMVDNQDLIDKINCDIDKLTNHADGIDNIVAVGSGILTGLVDSFFVGEFSLTEGQEWGSEKVNSFVKDFAKKNGYTGDNDNLKGAISFLEKKFGLASDSVTSIFGGGRQHHLRDFAHHPTPIGLFFSMFTQFTKIAIGTDTSGMPIFVDIEDTTFIGENLVEKFIYGLTNWIGHMISDMAGSRNFAGGGTGLPGPIVSLLKELSALLHPLICQNKNGNNVFSVLVSKLYNGTLLGERNEAGKIISEFRFDLRAELGFGYELGKQALPVLLNEIIVRGFYFVRRLIIELKNNPINTFSDLKRLDWKKTIPGNNRTINRMLTISCGTFMAVDMADAAIRSGLNSGGEPTVFCTNFILRVNFVGVVRFAIAVYSDSKMGCQEKRAQDERIRIYQEQIELNNAKVFFKQGLMWKAAKNSAIVIKELELTASESIKQASESWAEISNDISCLSQRKDMIEAYNPSLFSDISNLLN